MGPCPTPPSQHLSRTMLAHGGWTADPGDGVHTSSTCVCVVGAGGRPCGRVTTPRCSRGAGFSFFVLCACRVYSGPFPSPPVTVPAPLPSCALPPPPIPPAPPGGAWTGPSCVCCTVPVRAVVGWRRRRSGPPATVRHKGSLLVVGQDTRGRRGECAAAGSPANLAHCWSLLRGAVARLLVLAHPLGVSNHSALLSPVADSLPSLLLALSSSLTACALTVQ